MFSIILPEKNFEAAQEIYYRVKGTILKTGTSDYARISLKGVVIETEDLMRVAKDLEADGFL